MASHPKDRIRWGVLAFYIVALLWCFAAWYGIVRLASEMFFKLNQGLP